MSILSDDFGCSKFPKSSRFFNQSDLPDLKSFQLIKNNKQISFNSQINNINYNPFNLPQSKTKANFPMDFFHLPNKITLTDLPRNDDIPTFKLNEIESNDPIKMIENLQEVGKEFGAVKLVLPDSVDNLFRTYFQINSDLFWFQTNKLLNNSPDDELYNRLRFHQQLIKFHLNNSNNGSRNVSESNIKDLNNSSIKVAKLNNPKIDVNNDAITDNINATVNDSNHILNNDDKNINLNKASMSPKSNNTSTFNTHVKDIINHSNNLSTILNKPSPNNPDLGPSINGTGKSDLPRNNVDETEGGTSNTVANACVNDTSTNKSVSNANTNNHTNNASIENSKSGSAVNNSNCSTPLPVNNCSHSETHSTTRQKLPSFLNKLPMIDKRPLDLYKLFRSVLIRGGFMEVINKKLWAQIGRELGYKGKIMTSLSSSLKSSYSRILYPFEVYLDKTKYDLVGLKVEKPDVHMENDSHQNNQFASMNENGKRILNESFTPNKKSKISPPLIIGSSKDFKRSIKVKSSKGILLNSPHLIDIKQPNTFMVKHDEEVKKRNKRATDIIDSPILPQTQLNHALKSMIANQSFYQDDSRLKSNGKFASIYSLRQFMEKDLKFQEFIIQNNNYYFNKISTNSSTNFYHFNEPNMPMTERNIIKFEKFEELYWKFVKNDNLSDLLNDGLELENGTNIPSFINGSGFVKLGDDFINFKNNLNNINISSINNKSNSLSPNSSNTTNVESTYFNSIDYISKLFETALNPWNLHNLPVLPNSLLGALSENDLSDQGLTNSRINIGMTFSTENWRCEDHFTQLCNYQFFGAYKRWYFIPESEFEKFEALIKEINEKNKNRVNINNPNWNIEELLTYFKDENIEYDILISSLENMINPTLDIRLDHMNQYFQKLIEMKKSNFKFNQEFLITPDLLIERGIRFTTTIQKPGEFIIKYPKTYSSTISFGLNLSEEVNFATKSWLDYAIEGEKWLSKQSILPNFSTFRLILNLIQLYDSGKNIAFNSDIYGKITKIYDELYNKEIELRKKVRKLIKFKELILDEKLGGDVDLISDDDLVNTFPSKVVLTDTNTKQSFILSLTSFLTNFNNKTIPFEKFKVELHLMYSDEKLRNFSKILSNYSINYDNWMKNYERLMNENSDISLKFYKNLLNEGEKIYSAISSSTILSKLNNNDDYETIKLNTFKSYIENLKLFINNSNQFIEDCQTILSIKHQKRIRNGNDYQRSNGLNKLIQLLQKIPKLNFWCSEIDQILEFKNEIENFDKACRLLISKKNKSLQEFNDLISLGESFGIELPSLNFLIRLRDRLKWLETFKIIVKGGDPYSDKKEIFILSDLKDFFDQGLKILGKNDIELIKRIEVILNNSESFNRRLSHFLKIEYANLINIEELNELINQYKSNSFFIDLANYNHLLKLQSNIDLIESINEIRDSNKRSTYGDIKQLQNLINESGLKFDLSFLINELNNAESWIERLWEEIKELKLITTLTTLTKEVSFDQLNPRLSINNSLIEKLLKISNKIEFSFSDNDSYRNSSSYIAKFDEFKETDQKFYCICREFEFGTMIECDKCNEWYHIQCVHENEAEYSPETSDDSYTCPICKLIESGQTSDNFFLKQFTNRKLADFMNQTDKLRVYPNNEYKVYKHLYEQVSDRHAKLKLRIDEIKQLANNEMKLDELRFMLRKLYGGGVLIEELLYEVLNLVREYRPEPPNQPSHLNLNTPS